MNDNMECKILLVDDMEMNLVILSEIIKTMGHVPLSATSAKDALELLKNDLPQLILLDISMPDMDGIEFCKILKDDVYTREIPVIFISALDSQDDLSRAFEIGAVDYILKPFDTDDVKVRVSTHLKLYRMQKELEDTNRELNRVIKQQMAGVVENQKRLYEMISGFVSARNRIMIHACGEESDIVRILTQAMMFSNEFENEISESFISEVQLAAYMHDIGMLTVPEEILYKTEELTAEEREKIQNHVYGSDNIYHMSEKNNLGKSNFEKTLYELVRYHHENYDGTGYPEGLKGEDIPLSARIMRVVDSFDALVNPRIYRDKVYTVPEAIGILEEGAGTLYDADIVKILKKIQRQFIYE